MLENQVLEINGLTKTYGNLIALYNFSLEVGAGEICGMLGPNGSGKTTTLGILLDIIRADSGSFKWFGKAPDSNSRKRVGALLEQPLFYPYLSAVQNLRVICDIKNASKAQIANVLETVGLTERKHSKYKTYSLGMKQRLAIAAALIGDPEVLILDEPTNGLDPQGIAEIRDLIVSIASRGLTIVLASHLLDEVQKVCTHVVVLEKGKKLHSGPVNQVLNTATKFELASDDLDQLKQLLEDAPFVKEVKHEGSILLLTASEEVQANQINEYVCNKGVFLSHLSMRKQSLEKYFLELLEENHD